MKLYGIAGVTTVDIDDLPKGSQVWSHKDDPALFTLPVHKCCGRYYYKIIDGANVENIGVCSILRHRRHRNDQRLLVEDKSELMELVNGRNI